MKGTVFTKPGTLQNIKCSVLLILMLPYFLDVVQLV